MTAMTKSQTPGAMLKKLRLERQLTLKELRGRTGIPVSTLSKVENDKMYLNYDKLQALSTGLGIDIGVLFKKPAPEKVPVSSGRRSVHKIGDDKPIETHLNLYLPLASELRDKQFVPLIAVVRARSLAEFGTMLTHPGEEFTYVLDGALDFHSELYTPLRLNAGESVFFDSTMPHAYVAVGASPCRVLHICSTSEAQLFDALDRSRPVRKKTIPTRSQAVAEKNPAPLNSIADKKALMQSRPIVSRRGAKKQ